MGINKETDLVFLFSNWYSGATLFSFILNNHSQLVCNGEALPFRYETTGDDNYTCSCGSQIKKCDFFSNAASVFLDEKGQWSDDFSILPNIVKNKKLNGLLLKIYSNSWGAKVANILFFPFNKKILKYK